MILSICCVFGNLSSDSQRRSYVYFLCKLYLPFAFGSDEFNTIRMYTQYCLYNILVKIILVFLNVIYLLFAHFLFTFVYLFIIHSPVLSLIYVLSYLLYLLGFAPFM